MVDLTIETMEAIAETNRMALSGARSFATLERPSAITDENLEALISVLQAEQLKRDRLYFERMQARRQPEEELA